MVIHLDRGITFSAASRWITIKTETALKHAFKFALMAAAILSLWTELAADMSEAHPPHQSQTVWKVLCSILQCWEQFRAGRGCAAQVELTLSLTLSLV